MNVDNVATRGLVGFYDGSKVHLSKVRMDAYPAYLGLNVLGAARRIAGDFDNYYTRVKKLKTVPAHGIPSKREEEKYKKYARSVAHLNKPIQQWEDLLFGVEGDLLGYLDCGVMPSTDLTTWYYKWAWIVDMKDKSLECYTSISTAVITSYPLSSITWSTDEMDLGAASQFTFLVKFPLSSLPLQDEDFLREVDDKSDTLWNSIFKSETFELEPGLMKLSH